MNIYVWSIIIGGGIVTLLPRVLPITILSKLKLNPKIEEFLTYIPISILSALIAVELFTLNNKFSIGDGNYIELIAAVPTIFISIKKNNLLLTVLVGIISIAILRLIF